MFCRVSRLFVFAFPPCALAPATPPAPVSLSHQCLFPSHSLLVVPFHVTSTPRYLFSGSHPFDPCQLFLTASICPLAWLLSFPAFSVTLIIVHTLTPSASCSFPDSERDTTGQLIGPIDDVIAVVTELVSGSIDWTEACNRLQVYDGVQAVDE